MCKRVEQRIECPECGYPYFEACYGLSKYFKGLDLLEDTAYDPMTKRSIPDPGHTEDEE